MNCARFLEPKDADRVCLWFRREATMKTILLIATAAALSLSAHLAFAQSVTPKGAVTGMKPDRTTADTATRKAMQAKEATLRQKRSACRKQARAKKIPIFKRHAFVRDCTGR
jgi:hypothetical protein